MTRVRLTLACTDLFDRTGPLIAGDVDTGDLELEISSLLPIELMARYGEFDVCEVPLAALMGLHGREEWDYACIPVFPHRAFQHRNVIVRRGSGIRSPQDLAGKTIAVNGLYYSGTVWIRGILEEYYGLAPTDLRWVTAGKPGGLVRQTLADTMMSTPADIERVDEDVSDLLARGEADAWMGPTLPASYVAGHPDLERLFEDFRPVEERYADEVGYVPILHVVAIRRRVLREHPEVAGALTDIFARSRALGHERLVGYGIPACSLPWIVHDLEALPQMFGGDWFPHGLEENRPALETMFRYAWQQGVLDAGVGIDELFVPVA
ncbi:MAG: hypothetical protein GEU78_12375 [Actinobacteria bacterium]|nr:hypothetical protein [Actinomycetota bacterium]